MKNLSYLFLIMLISNVSVTNAQSLNRNLEPYTKLVVGPGINVELIKSDRHYVEMVSDSELLNEIVIDNNEKDLKIYFDYENFSFDDGEDFANSKYTLENTPYEGIKVYAKIYFVELESIDFRGDHKFFCKDPIDSDHMMIKVYGDNEMKLQSVKSAELTIKSYGENELEILDGHAGEVTVKAYGENRIMISDLKAETATLVSMGESDIDVHAVTTLKIKVFGEGNVRYRGNPKIKEFNIGEANVARLN